MEAIKFVKSCEEATACSGPAHVSEECGQLESEVTAALDPLRLVCR